MRIKDKIKFVIYTPRYDENVGGYIVLHKLCKMLSDHGYEAYIWPFEKPCFLNIRSIGDVKKMVRYILKNIKDKNFYDSPSQCKIAGISEVKKSIVVYPEIVAGNPLNAKKVVRWFLHKPGYHTGVIEYGEGELYFFFHKDFNNESINKNLENQLTILDYKTDIYQQKNFGERSGSCYMVRKGRDRALCYHPEGAVLVDELSHHEMAQAFNTYEYFISYDMYTLYFQYAAICGCKSVVVPMEGVTKEQWLSEEKDRYGVAYGFDDIEWAMRTKSKLMDEIMKSEEESERSIKYFIKTCTEFFV